MVVVWGPVSLRAAEADPRAAAEPAQSSSAFTEAIANPDYTFTSPTNWAYLATGANFPDALGAGPVGGMSLGPVLLVQQNAIPQATLNELNRLQPQNVVIVGGTGVISASVMAQVQALPYTISVTRVAGGNRFETAALLSEASYPTTGYYPRAGFTSDTDLPDGTGGEQKLLVVEMETGAGIVMAVGGVDLTLAGTDTAVCWIALDGAKIPGSERWVTIEGEQICSTEAAVVVDFGLNEISFWAQYGVGTEAYEGTIWALYNPFQNEGARISP